MSKHRSNVWVVVREEDDAWGDKFSGIVGVYRTAERADEVVGMCEQEMKDRGFDQFIFSVKVATYYDE